MPPVRTSLSYFTRCRARCVMRIAQRASLSHSLTHTHTHTRAHTHTHTSSNVCDSRHLRRRRQPPPLPLPPLLQQRLPLDPTARVGRLPWASEPTAQMETRSARHCAMAVPVASRELPRPLSRRREGRTRGGGTSRVMKGKEWGVETTERYAGSYLESLKYFS